ncbi:MAG: tripartite tricarboxylate transporter TctB family protein [Desulfovibrionaceae bacterium]|nr:tripartite tricarboxylate transporter TctB family protein [Desulfovibrionaceae bacterium]
MSLSENKWNFIIGLVFALISLCFLLFINDWAIVRPIASYKSERALILPSFFPNWICGMALVFAIGQMISSWLRMRAEKKGPQPEPYLRYDPLGLCTRIAAMGTLILLYYVADWLGIVLTGFLFFVLFGFFCGDRKIVRPIIGGALTSGILYYLFVKVAEVPMPLGILDFL